MTAAEIDNCPPVFHCDENAESDKFIRLLGIFTYHLRSLASLTNLLWQHIILPYTGDEGRHDNDVHEMDKHVQNGFAEFSKYVTLFCSPSEQARDIYLNENEDIDKSLGNGRLVKIYDNCVQHLSKPNLHLLY